MKNTILTILKYIKTDVYLNKRFEIIGNSKLDEYLESIKDNNDIKYKPFYYRKHNGIKSIKLKGLEQWRKIKFIPNDLYELRIAIRRFKYSGESGVSLDVITCKSVNLSLDTSSDSDSYSY